MRRATIVVMREGEQFGARLAGCEHEVHGRASAEEAVGLLVLLLCHPLGIRIEREKIDQKEDATRAADR